jgi:hypothetical protein
MSTGGREQKSGKHATLHAADRERCAQHLFLTQKDSQVSGGIEPSTYRLRSDCSAAKLRDHFLDENEEQKSHYTKQLRLVSGQMLFAALPVCRMQRCVLSCFVHGRMYSCDCRLCAFRLQLCVSSCSHAPLGSLASSFMALLLRSGVCSAPAEICLLEQHFALL